MLLERLGEHMPAGAVRHEIDGFRVRGVHHCRDAFTARVGDRSERQTRLAIGVVACLRHQFRPADPASKRLTLGDWIDDRRVGIELHADAQAVAVDARDHSPLRCLASLLLDNGCQRHDLCARGDRAFAAVLRKELIERLGHRRLHSPDNGRSLLAALISVAVGKDGALPDRRYCSRQERVRRELLRDDDRGHPFSYRDKALDGPTVLQQVENSGAAGPFRDLELAGLDRIRRAEQARTDNTIPAQGHRSRRDKRGSPRPGQASLHPESRPSRAWRAAPAPTIASLCKRMRRQRSPQAPAPAFSHGLHDEAGVGATKAEAVVQDGTDRPLLRLVRHEIDARGALARIVEVERRRDDLVAQGKDAEDALDRTGAAQQVADGRLGRAHRKAADRIAEQPANRAQLQLVAERRRGAVSIDVIDVDGCSPDFLSAISIER